MQSRKLEKSQYVTSLGIGKHLGVQSRLIFKFFFHIFNIFHELGKIEKSSQRNIQKSQELFVNWEKLGRKF